ncbi:MAG: acyl-CoA thioesterase [Cellvibrionaceae bacterium]|nr:acyl-CoA thioesterase [Cellvibrionaceae bacterium]MCV6624814.1 acyl-CoA thioesterase [Cellvibrionaceae bacterium]
MLQQVEVSAGQINLAGHADNEEIYRWFNQARLALFKEIGNAAKRKFVPPYVKCELQFKREVFDHAPIAIETAISHIGNKSFSIEQTIRQDGELCAQCVTVAVNFCVDSQRPILIEGASKSALEFYRP